MKPDLKSSFHCFPQQHTAETVGMIQWKESSLLKFSTFTYKHEFKSSQLVLPHYLFSMFIFSIDSNNQCMGSLKVSLSYLQPFLTSSSPNMEFTEAYPICRFPVTYIHHIKKSLKRAPFMIPGTNFATLKVYAKKTSPDAFCVSSSQFFFLN